MTETTLPVEAATTLPAHAISQPYWQIATSANTRRAYQSDIRHFISNGGLLPTTTEGVLHYLQQQAAFLNPRTLKRRLVGQHINMLGEYDFRNKTANNDSKFDIEKILALSI